MADQSVFASLDPSQLHYLKAQYLASLQLVDQREATLKQQLEDLTTARKQLHELMGQLDRHLSGGASKAGGVRAATATAPSRRRKTTGAARRSR